MKRKKKIFLIILLTLLVCIGLFTAYFFLTLPNVAPMIKHNPKVTALMTQRQKEAKDKTFKIHQEWVPFTAIPLLLKHTVRISEDASFYQHEGIDYYELKEAIKRNLKEGKKVRGGSTITQQLAKNIYLSTGKSYYRKIREFFIAKRLEKHLSKDRIFSLYLNVIEFGHGIFGVQAASRHFFKKPVNKLSLEEIVRLVSVIPKPLKVTPLSNSGYLKWRANLLLNRLLKYGYISSRQFHRTQLKFK